MSKRMYVLKSNRNSHTQIEHRPHNCSFQMIRIALPWMGKFHISTTTPSPRNSKSDGEKQKKKYYHCSDEFCRTQTQWRVLRIIHTHHTRTYQFPVDATRFLRATAIRKTFYTHSRSISWCHRSRWNQVFGRKSTRIHWSGRQTSYRSFRKKSSNSTRWHYFYQFWSLGVFGSQMENKKKWMIIYQYSSAFSVFGRKRFLQRENIWKNTWLYRPKHFARNDQKRNHSSRHHQEQPPNSGLCTQNLSRTSKHTHWKQSRNNP